MTVNNSQNIHDYLELTSADESMKLGSTEVIPPQLLSVTQKDMSFNDQLQHAELTVFPDLPFKPVPDVKESVAALDAVPPYYNATTASDIFVKPLESFEEVKRISYMDVPEVNRISYMDVPEKNESPIWMSQK
uniref:Uncharacterized protein n=1 Tax=Biomphalaria glabrata TaxID=6526 RepID=A0A2C9LSZ2_BIOGL